MPIWPCFSTCWATPRASSRRQLEDLTRIDPVGIRDQIAIGGVNDGVAQARAVGPAGDAPEIVSRHHGEEFTAREIRRLGAAEGYGEPGDDLAGAAQRVDPELLRSGGNRILRLCRPRAVAAGARFGDQLVAEIDVEGAVGIGAAGERQ